MPFDSLPVTSPAIDALRFGRSRLEQGWCQAISREGNAVCAVAATSFSPGALHWLCLALDDEFDNPNVVRAYNDTPERTKAEILALYDRAIDLAIADAIGTR